MKLNIIAAACLLIVLPIFAFGQAKTTDIKDVQIARETIELRNGGTLIIDGYNIRHVSNDPTLADSLNIDLVTEAAVKAFVIAYVAAHGGGGADNWGSQVVQKNARLTGNGTSGSPLDIAQMSATTGQGLGWNGTAWAPQTFWYASNDGAGSTLDADLLDGQSSAFYQNAGNLNAGTMPIARVPFGTANQLLRTNAGGTAAEWFTPSFLTGNQTITLSGDLSGSGTTSISATIGTGAVTSAKILDGTIAAADWAQMGAGTGQVMAWNGSAWAAQTVWYASNDGASSGLDADLLDGQSSAFYQNAGNLNAGTLPIARLPFGTANQLLRTNAGGTAAEWFTPSYLTANQTITLSGDLSGSGTTSISATIGTGAVTSAKILDGTIAAADWAQMGAGTGQVMAWNGSAWAATTISGGSAAGSSGQVQFNNSGSFAGNAVLQIINPGTIPFVQYGNSTTLTSNSLYYFLDANSGGRTITNSSGGTHTTGAGAWRTVVQYGGANGFSAAQGIQAAIIANSGLPASTITGISMLLNADSGTGQHNLTSGSFSAQVGTVNGASTLKGVYASTTNANASSTVTTAYGLEVAYNNLGTVTNTYGIYVGDVTSGTQINQAFGIYMSDSNAKNYFAGNSGFGNASATERVDITGNIKFSGLSLAADGSAAAPSYAFTSEPGTGLRRPTTGVLAVSLTGAEHARFTTTGLQLGTVGAVQGNLLLSGSTSGLVTVKGAAAAGTWTLTLPTTGGTSGYALTTNGSGVSTWSSIGLPGGSSTHVQYNNSGNFAGDADFTFDGTTVAVANPFKVAAGSASAVSIYSGTDSNNGWWFPSADVQAWSTNGTERMRLSSTGVLSLTNSAIPNLLSVVGNFHSFLEVTSPSGSGNAGIYLGNSGDATDTWMISRAASGEFRLLVSDSYPYASDNHVLWASKVRTTIKNGVLNVEPMTATAASSLTPANGDIVYVSTTNATFTSLGLWGYQNSVWTKI